MKKHLSKRIGSLCTSAVLSICTLASSGSIVQQSAVAADTDNYAKLLQYSLYFYDANMCGKSVDSKSGITWRGNCHTDDAVEGGFHDAGDHAVFGLPQGYAASTLGWAYHAFPDAFQQTGQTEHLKVITDYFCDFIRRSAQLNGDTVSRFLYQKGDGNEDHGYWGAPEKQGGGRKMFWTDSTGGDIAAEYAAALAANYVNFGNADDLTYAKAYYKYSIAHGSAATDGPTGFYDSKSVNDDQAWAAGWLYLATKDDYYLGELRSKKPDVYWVHSWNDVHLGTNCLYGEITGDWSGANSYIGSTATGSNFVVLTEWGSARYNCALQMCALVAEKNGKGSYKDWCKGQMTQILGQNPKNICLVTGFAANSAKNTHHRAASGYQGYSDGMGEGTTQYHPSNGKVLIGALAGGPADAGWTYSDVLNDYKCNEVAIDYNAGLVGAAAGLYSMYKTGSIDNNIVGVDKIYSGGGNGNTNTETQPTSTTATSSSDNNPGTTSTSVTTSGGNNSTTENGVVTVNVNKTIDYSKLPENDKMIGFDWKQFGLAYGTKVTKVEFNISANGNIGTYVGAYGSSTTVAPDYWTQSKDINESINSNKGTLTWNIDSDMTGKLGVTNGELKLGVWWVDCGTFTVDSIKVYTEGGTSTTTTPTTTATTVTTTPTSTTSTTTTTQTDKPAVSKLGDVNVDGDVNVSDAVLLARIVVNDKAVKVSDQGYVNADCDKNGNLNDEDLSRLLRYLAGFIPENQFR